MPETNLNQNGIIEKDSAKIELMKRMAVLMEMRKQILGLPPEKICEAILEYSHPAALVHSFPQEDFYFLVCDIGLEDSLELLSLASDRQLEYLLDMEIWEKDRIDMVSTTRWLASMLKADPDRMVRWYAQKNSGLILYYLFKNIEVLIREHDQEPSELGEGLFTRDDVFYFRFIDEPEGRQTDIAMRNGFISEFLERLAELDHVEYQDFLLKSKIIIPAEYEEEAFRLKNVRTSEKGFAPFHEAIGIYQPLIPDDFKKQPKKSLKHSDSLNPLPLYPISMLDGENSFTEALQLIDNNESLSEVLTEFAGMCNKVIAADQIKIKNREQLRMVVKKVCGYMNLGLSRLARPGKKTPVGENARFIQRYCLADIFRLGYGQCLELKWQAEKWKKNAWFEANRLPLNFWGEEWLGVLGGLLIKKPLFYDNYRTGVLYREFDSTEDIEKTKNVFENIIVFDKLLSKMDIDLKSMNKDLLWTYKNFVLTLWARSRMDLARQPAAVALDEFMPFYHDLWECPVDNDGETRLRKIKTSVKIDFINWISDCLHVKPDMIDTRIGRCLGCLIDEIESEYGQVTTDGLDPRFIHLFMLKP